MTANRPLGSIALAVLAPLAAAQDPEHGRALYDTR